MSDTILLICIPAALLTVIIATPWAWRKLRRVLDTLDVTINEDY